MTERDRLRDDLERTYRGDPWCGGSLREVLEGVSAEQAARRFPPLSHSIWEIVLHLSVWYGAVIRRLDGGPVELPEEGNWPPTDGASEAEWRQILVDFDRRHECLLAILSDLPDEKLFELLRKPRDQALGTGLSIASTLNGLSQHTIYHVGQITLLKKLAAG